MIIDTKHHKAVIVLGAPTDRSSHTHTHRYIHTHSDTDAHTLCLSHVHIDMETRQAECREKH